MADSAVMIKESTSSESLGKRLIPILGVIVVSTCRIPNFSEMALINFSAMICASCSFTLFKNTTNSSPESLAAIFVGPITFVRRSAIWISNSSPIS